MLTQAHFFPFAVPHTVAILVFILIGLAGCAAPAVLLDGPGGDGYRYRLRETGWVRYAGEQPLGLVDPTVLHLRRYDGVTPTLNSLRALGLTGLDHVRSSTGAIGAAEVHFVSAEHGFAGYRLLLQANRADGAWADLALHPLGSGSPDARLAQSVMPGRALGSR